MYLTLLRRYYIFIAVLAVFFFMIILKGDIFLSEYNIRSVARELSFIGIISCGVCLLMTMGHFDLSVGVVFTMGAVLSAMLVKSDFIRRELKLGDEEVSMDGALRHPIDGALVLPIISEHFL